MTSALCDTSVIDSVIDIKHFVCLGAISYIAGHWKVSKLLIKRTVRLTSWLHGHISVTNTTSNVTCLNVSVESFMYLFEVPRRRQIATHVVVMVQGHLTYLGQPCVNLQWIGAQYKSHNAQMQSEAMLPFNPSESTIMMFRKVSYFESRRFI